MIKITQKQKKIKQLPKKDLILIFSSVLLLGFISLIVFKLSPKTSHFLNPLPQIIGQAVLTIDFGNNEKRAFSGDIIENETLVDVLTQAAKAGYFSYKLNENADVVLIEDISSRDKKFLKNNNKSWHWYLNNKKISKSPNEIISRDGDNILIKYE